MDLFLIVKWVHVLSATLLFGTGIGTAFHMWMSHLRGDPVAVATTARNVIRADCLFTVPAGILQPASGIAMVFLAGYDPWSPWLIATYCLYLIALGCWLPVMALQYRVAGMAAGAVAASLALPSDYHRAMRLWFWLGWPAFLALLAIFGLMIFRPA